MNAILDFYGIIGILAIGQLLILILFLVFREGPQWQIKIAFLLILGVIGFVLIHDTLVQTRLILYFPQFAFHGESFALLIWPFIFFYIKIAFGKKLHWIEILHLVPFLLYQYSRMDLIFLLNVEKQQILETYYMELDQLNANSIRKLSISAFTKDFVYYRLQPIVYISWILIFIKKMKGKDIISKSKVNIRWIQLIFYGYLGIWLARYLHYLGGFIYPALNANHPFQMVFLALQVVLLSLLLLKSAAPPDKIIYKKENRSLETLHGEMLRLFYQDKIFLDSELSIKKLADRLNSNSKYISLISNEYFHKSFSELVNGFRIEEAKKLLKDSSNRQYTIEAIAQKAGFKSVATFNRVFKKTEKMTPSQYLRFINS